MKKWISLCLILMLSTLFFGNALGESAPVRVGALKGPTAMGMVKMMSDWEGNGFTFQISSAIDEIIPQVVQGKLDITALPANLASVLYHNTKGELYVLAINTLGVLYIVETGDSVESIEDLRGRTLFASGKGATPEFALNYILSANGISPETDVTIEWKAEHTECVAALSTSKNGIALLPQPFVTTAQMKNDTIRIALDLTEEWEKAADTETPSSLITGVVVARKSFADENPDKISTFLNNYAISVSYVNANIPEAAALIGQYDIVPAPVAEKALPYCNIVFWEGAKMQQALNGYLAVLMKQNEKSVGGALPDATFYYAR